MWYILILVLICAALILYFVVRGRKGSAPFVEGGPAEKPGPSKEQHAEAEPETTYVCDICGKKNCVCHKETKH